MLIDTTKLPPVLASALRRDMAAGWAPSLTAYTPDASQNGVIGQSDPSGTASGETADQTKSGLLAAKTAQYLIDLYQTLSSGQSQTNGSGTSAADTAIGILDSTAGYVNAPVEADQTAQNMTGHQLALVTMGNFRNPLNGTSGPLVSVLHSSAEIAKIDAAANAIQPQLQSLYSQDKGQGKTGAQTVADLLALQLAQPQSYWDARDPDKITGNAKEIAQIQLSVLQQSMADNTGSSSPRQLTDTAS